MADLLRLAFGTDDGFGGRARIGLVVLENDQTVEAELRGLWPDGVTAFVTRIPMEDQVTPETLLAMEERIPAAAGLLPSTFGFDAIGYGCTSAATLIGEDGVDAAIRRAHPEVPNTNPMAAAVAAMGALGAVRIGVVTPYSAEVTAGIVGHLTRKGLAVAVVGSFLEESDSVVARITEESVAAAVIQLVASDQARAEPSSETGAEPARETGVAQAGGGAGSLDAVFVSCTSLRAFGIVEDLEADLGIPVVSSNLAFGWHLLRLAGVEDAIPGLGRLYRFTLDGSSA
ncbi:MAG: Asp/Glu racemase [Acidimicrobiaceae bacterium]|nr:Asp/Glu racemase [Acidimicrobiaceae bacterium]